MALENRRLYKVKNMDSHYDRKGKAVRLRNKYWDIAVRFCRYHKRTGSA